MPSKDLDEALGKLINKAKSADEAARARATAYGQAVQEYNQRVATFVTATKRVEKLSTDVLNAVANKMRAGGMYPDVNGMLPLDQEELKHGDERLDMLSWMSFVVGAQRFAIVVAATHVAAHSSGDPRPFRGAGYVYLGSCSTRSRGPLKYSNIEPAFDMLTVDEAKLMPLIMIAVDKASA